MSVVTIAAEIVTSHHYQHDLLIFAAKTDEQAWPYRVAVVSNEDMNVHDKLNYSRRYVAWGGNNTGAATEEDALKKFQEFLKMYGCLGSTFSFGCRCF